MLGISVAVAFSGCGGSSPASTPEGDVNAAFDKRLNESILVDRRGRTLYVFDFDKDNTPSCYDDATFHCSKGWPPLLVSGAVKAGPGVNQALLTTVTRKDGTIQVTFNRHPLYTFEGFSGGNAPAAPADTKPGDLNGQGYVRAWWVLSPAGDPIKTTPAASG